MVLIAADRRALEAEPDDEAERLAAEAAAEYLALRLRLARLLLRIERSGTFHRSACSSAVQYAVRLGIPAPEARTMIDLGRALEASPADASAAEASGDAAPVAAPVEGLIREGALAVANAALLGKLLAHPEALRDGEDWLGRAAALPTPELRREVNRRLEETAQGAAPLVSLTLHVTDRAREDFHRARVLASRDAAILLTEGQAFTRIVRSYLDARDETRRGAGSRRTGPTGDAPGTRYIPAEVRREVLARSGDRCEVPGCTLTTFLQFAHIRPHAGGGSREAENLFRACPVHHTQFDADCLVLSGWRDGHPVFSDAGGREITAALCAPQVPRERGDDLADAVLAHRAFVERQLERPPPT